MYHATANANGACDGNRYTSVDRVSWKEDDSPDFGVASPLGEVLVGPAGEPAA